MLIRCHVVMLTRDQALTEKILTGLNETSGAMQSDAVAIQWMLHIPMLMRAFP